jgi:hypothetical protein
VLEFVRVIASEFLTGSYPNSLLFWEGHAFAACEKLPTARVAVEERPFRAA